VPSQFQYRTDQKLRYAGVHLEELSTYPHATSNDEWENAHQESSFFHLAGAVEALLHEINNGYSLGVGLTKVTWKTVADRLSQSNQSSPAFDHLTQLRNDATSWLALLFEWRNHGTHRQRVGKIVNLSTSTRVDNQFKDPRSGQPPNVYPELGCLDVLKHLANDVRSLIDYCRRLDPRL
jgi:Family of unknown function (DUF6586)